MSPPLPADTDLPAAAQNAGSAAQAAHPAQPGTAPPPPTAKAGPEERAYQAQFVAWLRSVAPYIHLHRGKTFVIAIAGELIAAGRLNALVQDVALLSSMGIKVVLVHGFRPQVEEQLRLKGHPSQYSHGMRITDGVALDCAQEAAGQLRFEIEAAFSQGLPNTPMAGAAIRVVSGNFVTARPVGILDGVDFQHSGLVRKIDTGPILRALDFGAIVLLSPFGFSPTGEAFNLSMEDVATRTALAVKADKLIFVSEIDGVRDPQGRVITELPLDRAEAILAALPKQGERPQPTETAFYLRHAIEACKRGVPRSHILPFALDGSVLLEVFMHDGVGTMIVDENLESLREATIDDVGGILSIITPLEDAGILVRRSRTDIERDIESFSVIEHDGVIFGCAALFPFTAEGIGELACLAVNPNSQGMGDGDRLLKRIEQRARAQGLQRLFVLTTRTMQWFQKRGFVPSDVGALPKLKQQNYNWARKSQVLIKNL